MESQLSSPELLIPYLHVVVLLSLPKSLSFPFTQQQAPWSSSFSGASSSFVQQDLALGYCCFLELPPATYVTPVLLLLLILPVCLKY